MLPNDQKRKILEYFLLCEALEPQAIQKETASKSKSNKSIFRTNSSSFIQDIIYRAQNCLTPNPNIQFSVFGSLFKIASIQTSLLKFANAYTPNIVKSYAAGFALHFFKAEFAGEFSCVFDAIPKSVQISLSPLIASRINENTNFEELLKYCSSDIESAIIAQFLEKIQKKFIDSRTDIENQNENEEHENKHFYIKLDQASIQTLYQDLEEIFNQHIENKIFFSHEAQVCMISSQKQSQMEGIINSFYIKSLNQAINFYKDENASDVLLDNFLDPSFKTQKFDIRDPNFKYLKDKILSLKEFSAGAYPMPIGLNQSQYFALNAMFKRFCLNNEDPSDFLNSEGFYAVNGAPGTGKTTIVKDIIAAIFTRRAIELSKLEEYEIFTNGALNPRLCGFEMLILSNNNLALENISTEIQNLTSITPSLQEKIKEIDYFSSVTTKMLVSYERTKHPGTNYEAFREICLKLKNSPVWGSFCATFGSAKNLNDFQFGFAYKKNNNPRKNEQKDIIFEVLSELCPELLYFTDKPTILGCIAWAWKNQRVVNFKEAKTEFKTALFNLAKIIEVAPNAPQSIDIAELKKQRNELDIKLKACDDGHLIKKLYTKISEIDQQIQSLQSVDENENFLCDEEFIRARQNVFLCALKLHKAAILSNVGSFTDMFRQFVKLIALDPSTSKSEYVELLEKADELWACMFFIIPAVTSTFAAFDKCFKTLKSVGTIIIDEAGQAALSSAVGPLHKAKRAIVIGDPMQLEPVVILPSEINDFLLRKCGIDLQFNLANSSVQIRADKVEPYGTHISRGTSNIWLGSPLLSHKRCDYDIFNIANNIAYGGLMSWGKKENESKFKNAWLDIPHTNKGVDINDYTQNARLSEIKALKKLLISLKHKGVSSDDVSVLTPFVDVCDLAYKYNLQVRTVHTMQGRQARIVIFVLGGKHQGARAWASTKPNLLNVALTRAKENFFVIGDYQAWSNLPYFKYLAQELRQVKFVEEIFK